jgi:hypothetical protein
MSSSPTCGCCVCPAHAGQSSGGDVGLRWAGPAREYLESVVAWLDGPEAMGAGHGELEARLQVDAREQYRLLLQGHLDQRAAREPRRAQVTGSDGVARPRVENGHRRGLVSVFGPVTVTRKAYRATPTRPLVDAGTAAGTAGGGKTAGNLCPADAVLNLPAGKHSAGLARLAAAEAARGSFDDAAAAIERATGVRVGKRQVEDLAGTVAVDVDAFYAARRPDPCPSDRVLVLQADGKGIVMRPDGLRPATAAQAATRSAKLTTRLSPGEKHGRKRMAEIVAVYDHKPTPRTVEDIIPAPRRPRPPPRPAPVTTGKWLTASVTDDIPAVIAAMFTEAERRDPPHERTWIALVDGNRQQIEAIRDQATTRGVAVTVLVDFVHVLEYLWKAAWTFFYPGDPDAETWVADHARTILTGRAIDTATTINHQADTGGFDGNERKGAHDAVAYLTNKAPYLDYATALERGWPIATGVIEGACRYLVKDRMDITGARWSLPGAEAILKLRALITNGHFDEYWNWHQHQQQRRNHLNRYKTLDLAA